MQTSDILHLQSDVWRHKSNIYQTSDIRHHAYIRHQMSYIFLNQTTDSWHQTDIRHLTSEIQHNTNIMQRLDILHQTSQIKDISHVWHQTSYICHTSDVWHQICVLVPSDIWQQKSDTRHHTWDVDYKLYIRCLSSHMGYLTSDVS